MDIRELIYAGDLEGLETALNANPALASQNVALPDNPESEHPLHRLCDGVFAGIYSEETALALAKIFVQHGSDVNVEREPGKDSPLTAACSLGCDQLALFYIDMGANIDHQGCHGGTALHWSAWCGRDNILSKLLELHPEINKLCIEFKSTPLFWAIHGYKFGGEHNRHHQIECARILLAHGADASIPNFEGYLPVQLLEIQDNEALDLFMNPQS